MESSVILRVELSKKLVNTSSGGDLESVIPDGDWRGSSGYAEGFQMTASSGLNSSTDLNRIYVTHGLMITLPMKQLILWPLKKKFWPAKSHSAQCHHVVTISWFRESMQDPKSAKKFLTPFHWKLELDKSVLHHKVTSKTTAHLSAPDFAQIY